GETPKAAESGAEVQVGEGPVHVVIATADQLFKDIPPSMTSKLPTVKGDLELINHSAGSLTSQAYHKRWVLKNELLADAAEKSSLAAAWMGGAAYPQQRLNDAWMLALGGHFHDTAAGTATPKSYEYAWNDDAIVANQFNGVLTSASQAIASGLDTEGAGIPVVLFNPLNVEREDVVEADLHFAGATPKSVTVTDAQGKEVPAQIAEGKVLFLATVPSVGYAVYHVQAAQKAAPSTGLKVTNSSIENARYLVKLNGDGDVSSIYDKQTKKELLSAPVRLAISNDKPRQWPAWNMDFDQEQAAPRSFVAGKPTIRIKENGPVRVALEVTREAEGSKFVQTISLSAGNAGNRVVWANSIDWKTSSANLKVAFPLSASNENATYNWDLGTQTDWQAYRMNAPVIAFQTGKHQGTLGKSFSLVHLNNSRIRVLALKKAEDSDETILRMVELDGKPAQDVQVSFAGPIASAREVNAQEQSLGNAVVEQGVLKTSFTAYQPRTFAIRLANATAKLNAVQSQAVPLQYDLATGSNDDTATNGGGFDGKGNAIPAEMLPDKIDYHGVVFDLASAKTGNANAVVAKGQTIKLPEGHFNRVYVLAASADGDQTGVFKVGTHTATLKIQDWTGYIGQWDTRLWKEQPGRDWAISANHAAWPPADLQQREARPPAPRYPDDYIGLKPGFLKTAGLAWYASHIHTPQGLNQPYQYSYLFAYPIDLAEGAKTITLPNNDKIRILAISTAQESEKLTVATSLLEAPKPAAEPPAAATTSK
ncbi:glycoside hydrolase family 38 C-terminal domain-containing protein, partial [Terriglobus sp. YAF25]|uniref:glycoside hydrolase family 38 C-terminal domain-containing protein n=1 Tax=Terriglobus sp. YAF25 TaxID=3233080 RepID=UPI003F9C892C